MRSVFTGFHQKLLHRIILTAPSEHTHRKHLDEHLIPSEGTLNLDMLIDFFNEIGYKSNCVLESHYQSVTAPDEALDEILIRLLTSVRKSEKRTDNKDTGIFLRSITNERLFGRRF
ncbi:MAG: hypothetical protein IJN21_06300 [Clostridia bacterium]|nr:hypothetical protein [Clostridia bacterium]